MCSYVSYQYSEILRCVYRLVALPFASDVSLMCRDYREYAFWFFQEICLSTQGGMLVRVSLCQSNRQSPSFFTFHKLLVVISAGRFKDIFLISWFWADNQWHLLSRLIGSNGWVSFFPCLIETCHPLARLKVAQYHKVVVLERKFLHALAPMIFSATYLTWIPLGWNKCPVSQDADYIVPSYLHTARSSSFGPKVISCLVASVAMTLRSFMREKSFPIQLWRPILIQD